MSAPGRAPPPSASTFSLAGAPGRDAALRATLFQPRLTLCGPVDCSPARLLCPWGFSRQEYRSGLPFGECSLRTSLAFSETPYKREVNSPSIYMDHPSSQTWCQLLESLLGFPRGSDGKESTSQCRRLGFYPWVGKIPWRRKTKTHSSTLAWRIPWTEESGGLQSLGLQKVGHDSVKSPPTAQVFMCLNYSVSMRPCKPIHVVASGRI